jgi:hypothetical protein
MSDEPVAEQILAKVQVRLAEITTINGYQFNVVAVERAKRFTTGSPSNLKCYVSMDSLTPSDVLSHSGNPPVQGWDMVVRCAMIVTPPETDLVTADAWRLRAYAAMSKAITTGNPWWTWDNLAVNSQILAPEGRSSATDGQIGAHVLVNIQFRTDESDPYQVRF